MDYTKWPIKQLDVKLLRLDPENPRLATAVKRPTQRELIADLLVHEDVLPLLRDISRVGYFPELLYAIRDGANLIVVEGNRRLAALKLLLNPELAPPEYQKRVQQYADRVSQKVSRVPVAMAPSREAVVPIIIARHKGEAVKSWTTVMQARFVQSRIDHGLSLDDVALETGLDRTEILKTLRDAKLYDVIRSLPLEAPVQQVVEDPRRFPFTTLRRLIDYSAVQNLLGIETDEKHGFVTTVAPGRFQVALARVVTDITNGAVTSRTHNTAAQVDGYIRDIRKSLGRAPASRSVRTPADAFVDPSRVQPKPRPRKSRKGSPKTQVPTGLIPKGFRIDVDDQRICDMVSELKSLPILRFPNATAVTFRSLLDMAVTRYLHECGELKVIKANMSTKQNKGADWIPTLNQQLNHILKTSTIPLGPEARKALQKFVSDSNSSLTLDSLNWFTHIRYVPPTVEQLRAFWTMLTPLFELTLLEPES